MISLPSIPAPATASVPVQGLGPVGLGLWQLGIEAQSLTAQIAALAEKLEAEDPLLAQSALGELESVLLQEEGNKQKLSDKADATCWVIDHPPCISKEVRSYQRNHQGVQPMNNETDLRRQISW